MPKIAISYRRDDTLPITGRIYDRLAARYGEANIFRDIDAQHAGVDFRRKIDRYFGACDVALAIIGPKWLGPKPDGSLRIRDAGDYVRYEIESGLKRDIPVIPILIDKTPMPAEADLPDTMKGFAYHEAVDVSSDADFKNHLSNLIQQLDRTFADRGIPNPQPQQTSAASLGSTPLIQITAFLLVAVALIRLSIALSYGLSDWFARHPFNYAEFAILMCLAPLVALYSLRGGQLARTASMAICAFGILDGLYFFARAGWGNPRLLTYAAAYAFALFMYWRWGTDSQPRQT
jgi:hypothetical protein